MVKVPRPCLALQVLLLLLCAGAPSSAQRRVETLKEQHFPVVHQPAGDLVGLIRDLKLLSPQGSVELRSDENTVVVRDHASRLRRVDALLRDYDHPPRQIRVFIYVLRARRGSASRLDLASLPPWLAVKLQEELVHRGIHYELLGRADAVAAENEELELELSRAYRVSFRLGTVVSDLRLKLHRFEVLRLSPTEPARRVISADVNSNLDRPMILGVSQRESSGAELVVALRCSQQPEEESAGSAK